MMKFEEKAERHEMKKGKKVLVGMSGGVDSTVSAILLQKEGYEVEGVYMKLHQKEGYHEENFAKVQRVGEYLGIKVHFLDLSSAFKEEVYDYFIESYKAGLTPNPWKVGRVCGQHRCRVYRYGTLHQL